MIIMGRFRETAPMPKKPRAKRGSLKNLLRLPDLDHSKTSVLQSPGSVASKRTYAFAINYFITWYCSEPRLAFTVDISMDRSVHGLKSWADG
jgi:hypothetical protein